MIAALSDWIRLVPITDVLAEISARHFVIESGTPRKLFQTNKEVTFVEFFRWWYALPV